MKLISLSTAYSSEHSNSSTQIYKNSKDTMTHKNRKKHFRPVQLLQKNTNVSAISKISVKKNKISSMKFPTLLNTEKKSTLTLN